MRAFTTITSVAAPLPQDNIDTDIIYPARFLLVTRADGLGEFCFRDWRFDKNDRPLPDFPLAQPQWAGSEILVTGANFGCGSSREHAPWSLRDMGARAIIAPSFGEIFYGNCLKNGLLPILVGEAEHARLMADAQAARELTVDLQANEVRRASGEVIGFTVPDRARDALLNGWDEVTAILAQYGADITAFENSQRRVQPWLWTNQGDRA
jgi:3-isopropylmalate/(R)-2-methylmalate dehydratase small subunit